MGSGIRRYEYSLDGETWKTVETVGPKKIDGNTYYERLNYHYIDLKETRERLKVVPADGTYTIRVRAVDCHENVSEETSYTIKLDTTKPKCGLKVKSGTLGENSWYKTKITVGYNKKDGTGSNIVSSPIRYVRNDGTTVSSSSTVEIKTEEENLKVTATLTDEAGNITTCSLQNLNIDPTIPTLTLKESTVYIYQDEAKDISSYYTDSYGISGGVTECKLVSSGEVVTNTSSFSSLDTKVEEVQCTAVSTAGNKSAVKTITFRKQYDVTERACVAYNSCANSSACGTENGTCKTYNSRTDASICGTHQTSECAVYKECVSSSCSCKTYYWAWTNPDCGSNFTRSGDCSRNGGTVECCEKNTTGGRTPKCNVTNCVKTNLSSCQVYNSCRVADCGCETYATAANSCSNSAFGCAEYNQVAKTCEAEVCGCKTYEGCENSSSCGQYKECEEGSTLVGTVCRY